MGARIASLSLGLFALAATAGTAGAAPPPTEVAHDIEVELHAEHATLLVRRTLVTDWADQIEGRFFIDGDQPLVATDLRTRGDDGTWYRAKLLPVDEAVDTYWALTGSKKVVPEGDLGSRVTSLEPEDPALMMWDPGGFRLFVFPVTDGAPRTVEYTLLAPYVHEDGERILHVPIGSEEELPPRVRFAALARGLTASVDGAAIVHGTELQPVGAGTLDVRIDRPARGPLSLQLASTPAGDRHLARITLHAAKALGPDPDDTHAVIVLDRSRSMGNESLRAAQIALVAYLDALAAVPGARAEVVQFHREVMPQHGAFVTPKEARDELARATLELKNGSDLPAALAEAAARLATAPRGVPRRVIVVTDTALAPAHEASIVAAFASLGALVHLADVQGGDGTRLEVDDRHRLSEAVTRSGGLVWTATVDGVEPEPGDLFSAWIRPMQIRRLEVRADDDVRGTLDLPRGDGALDVLVQDERPKTASATGWLWGERIRVRAHRTSAGDRTWTRLAPAYLDPDLDDDEVLDLATRAHAVSPRTSLLALQPDAEPGQALDTGSAERRFRTTGCGYGGGTEGGFGRYSLQFHEPEFIETEVQAAIGACRATALAIDVELTTSYAEVVAVDRVEGPDDPATSDCLRDALWAIELPPGRHAIVRHVVHHRPGSTP